jgi:hypothetical protein
MLNVAFNELAAGGPEQMLANEGRLSVNDGHYVL